MRKNFINETGNVYGELTVENPTKDKNGRSAWNCKCSCGNYKIARGSDLRAGKITSCGCKKIERLKSSAIDISGQIFHDLQAIKYEYTKGKRQYWSFLCLLCGKITIKNKLSVTNGNTTNCGCNTTYLQSHVQRIYEKPGTIYNYLQVEEPAFDDDYVGKSIYWYKCLNCGCRVKKFAVDVRSGNVKSCGCVNSFKELEIKDILIKNNILYKTQYTYADLISSNGGRLRFDFALLNKNNEVLGLIEYQGDQHFNEARGDFGRQQREETDGLKVEYCLKYKIPLLILDKNNNLEEDILRFNKEIENYGNT